MRRTSGTMSKRIKTNSLLLKNRKNTIDKKEEKPMNEKIIIFSLFLTLSISIFNIITIPVQGIINRSKKIKERTVFTMKKS